MDQVERRALSRGKLVWREQVQNRRSLVAQPSWLKSGRQKTVRVIGCTAERACLKQHHIPRQILVLRSQPVGHPRAETPFSRTHIARVHLVTRGSVIVAVRLD